MYNTLVLIDILFLSENLLAVGLQCFDKHYIDLMEAKNQSYTSVWTSDKFTKPIELLRGIRSILKGRLAMSVAYGSNNTNVSITITVTRLNPKLTDFCSVNGHDEKLFGWRMAA